MTYIQNGDYADQILVLDNGRLVEHGTHDELMKKNGLYHKLFHIQQESLGYNRPDDIPITLSTVMQNIIDDKTLDASQGIIHHREGVDLLPSNIELSGFEVRLINAMSRERVLKTYVNEVKKNYDFVSSLSIRPMTTQRK